MPPVGRKFEAPKLPPEQEALRGALFKKGAEVQTIMNRLLPNKGIVGPNKTKYVEYQTVADRPDTKMRAWLQRDRTRSDGSIQLKVTPVPFAQPDQSTEGWDIQTFATIDTTGRLKDDKYRDLFPEQRLELLNQVLETVRFMEAQLPPVTEQQLGRTALNG